MPIEMKSLEEVAIVHDERCSMVRGVQRLLRRGPYDLYVETGAAPFDDYAFDGTYLLLGSVCNVEAPDGNLKVTEAKGKFWATDLYHVISCDNDIDTAYLRFILSSIPADRYAEISGQTVRLPENRLRHIQVPWPCEEVRIAYVRFMRRCLEAAETAHNHIQELYDKGVCTYQDKTKVSSVCRSIAEVCDIHTGKSLDATMRNEDGAFTIVSSQGVLGHTDEQGVCGPCMLLGQAGQFIIGRRMDEDTFPLSDCVALTVSENDPISFEEIVFALLMAGVRPRLRVKGKTIDALAMPIEKIAELEILVAEEDQQEELRAQLRNILSEIDRYKALRIRLHEEERMVTSALFAGANEIASLINEGFEQLGLDKSSGCTIQLDNQISSGLLGQTSSSTVNATSVTQIEQDQLAELVQKIRYILERKEQVEVSSFEAAWEVMPFLFLRYADQGEFWLSTLNEVDRVSSADERLNSLSNTNERLSFLSQLTGESSRLSPEERLEIMLKLDMLSDSQTAGEVLRWFALTHTTELMRKGPAVVEKHLESYCPVEVKDLLVELACVFAPNAQAIFDPCARNGEMLAALRAYFPNATLLGQTQRFPDALLAVMAAYCEGWVFTESALQVGNSLTEDGFKEGLYDLVVSLLPPNQGEWTNASVDKNDKRWVFGVPPRNKANLAWLQHAFTHCKKGGYAILLTSNAVLHESRGCEPIVRSSLIESGCVRAVISLPGGLFRDGRSPMSCLVLGDTRAADTSETLFINALSCGIEYGFNEGSPMRVLPQEVASRVVDIAKYWITSETCGSQPGFARSVKKEEIRKTGDLTPWAFV